jgi:hypothetical protein
MVCGRGVGRPIDCGGLEQQKTGAVRGLMRAGSTKRAVMFLSFLVSGRDQRVGKLLCSLRASGAFRRRCARRASDVDHDEERAGRLCR